MKSRSELLGVLIIIVLASIWGSSFILMKRALFDLDGNPVLNPIQVGGLRVVIAGLVLMPIALLNVKKISQKNWLPLLIAGLFGNCIPAFLFAKAQETLDSSFSGILNSLTPLFTFIITISFFKTKFKWLNFLGIIVGFAGTFGLLFSEQLNTGGNTLMSLLVILATLCYAISVNVIKYYLKGLKPLVITSLAFSFVCIPTLILLLNTNFAGVIRNHAHGYYSLGYVTILAIVGTAFAVALFNVLIKRTSVILASSVTYLIPIVAILWGIWDGEELTLKQIFWTVVILFGVYFVKDNSQAKKL